MGHTQTFSCRHLSTDSSQIVVSVEQGKRQGNDANMVVTYVKLATKAGFTDGYAETRRIEQKRNLRVIFTTYGLATSIVSTGIPDVKDTLTGETVGLDAICTDVVLDDRVYPGLVSVQATWVRVRTYINYKHTNTATTTATATDTDTLTRTKTKTNTNSATGTVSGSTTVTLTKTDTDTNSATKSKTSTTTATLSQTVTGDT